MIEIFASDRTVDEPFAAVVIDQALTAKLGPERIFRDSRAIPPGAHIPPAIWQAVQRYRVLIAVIGPQWHDMDTAGRLRIEEAADYVRIDSNALASLN